MRASKVIIPALAVCAIVLTGCGPSWPFGSNPPTPTATPAPQYCFSSFKQTSSLQINNLVPTARTVTVPADCIPIAGIKFDQPVSVPVDAHDPTISVVMKKVDGTATVHLPGEDIFTVDNCKGASDLQQIVQVNNTMQKGVLVASQFYLQAPPQLAGDYDRIARALFETYIIELASFRATTFITAPILAHSGSKIQQKITWVETFVHGLVTVTQANGTVIKDLTYAIPIGLQVDETAYAKAQPVVSSCS